MSQKYLDKKNNLVKIPKKGRAFDFCATKNEKYLCCNIRVLRSLSNCPYNCSYCFLQNYLTNETHSYTDDIQALLDEVYKKIKTEPWRFFRIGTWELGDSLAFEYKSGQAAKLIKAFAKIPSALLELKTKSDCVDTILELEHNQRTVISWSLNPAKIINTEEHKTASLEMRLTAIKKAAQAGYLIALHFDPMIYYQNWQKGYQELISETFKNVRPDQITWISMGSLRFNPEQKKLIEINFPNHNLISAEMVLGDDSKLRYIKQIRMEMYEFLLNEILKIRVKEDGPFIYLCMERWDMWEKIFSYKPDSIGHLDYLITNSLYTRFPGLVHEKPDLKKYLQFQNI